MADEAPTPAPTQSPGVPAWSPEGELVYIPAFDQAAAFYGFRPATPEDVHSAQMESKYGGFGQGLAAAGEGALNALTLGTGTAALHGLGITTPRPLRAEQKCNPSRMGSVLPWAFSARSQQLL